MAPEIWYDQEPENDLGPGDPAIILTTADELDEFLDRIVWTSAGPPVIEVSIAGHPERGVLKVGVGPDRGFINFLADDGGLTAGDGTKPHSVPWQTSDGPGQVDQGA